MGSPSSSNSRPEPHTPSTEDVELGLGPEVHRVGQAGPLQVVLSFLGDVARVAAVGLPRDRVAHETVQVERDVLTERVEDRGVRIGDQEHVGLLDLLEAADRRAVEAVPVVEAVFGQLVNRHREVLHDAGQVAEAQVDEGSVDALGEVQDLLRGTALHVTFLRSDRRSPTRPSRGRSSPMTPGSCHVRRCAAWSGL